jgi:hypothetical protein
VVAALVPVRLLASHAGAASDTQDLQHWVIWISVPAWFVQVAAECLAGYAVGGMILPGTLAVEISVQYWVEVRVIGFSGDNGDLGLTFLTYSE